MDGRPLPSVESLRCFVAVAEHLNFRRAAAEIALTPGALSQRVKQLEGLLDVQLFDRSPRHVELTAAGQRLLERARPALDAVRACAETEPETAVPIRFSLGTRFELGMSWILPALLALEEARPLWTIDLVFGSGDEILGRLEHGRVDAIVTSAPTADERWTARTLHAETYALVAAPRLLERRPFDSADDAAEHTLLDIDRSLPLARYAQSVCPNLSFARLWCGGTGAAVHALARAGRGVAVLPQYMVSQDVEQGALVTVLPELELLADSFRLLYRKASPLAGVLDELAEELAARPLT